MIFVGLIASSGNNVVPAIRASYTHHGSSTVSYDPAVLPSTLSSLIDDPIYRRYIRTPPRLAATLREGQPWQVWALSAAGRWRGGKFATYADAWPVVVRAMKAPAIRDVSLVSRRQLFRMPDNLIHLVYYPYEWCPRCRRPTMYELFHKHHGMPTLMDPDQPRCVFCGIRRTNGY